MPTTSDVLDLIVSGRSKEITYAAVSALDFKGFTRKKLDINKIAPRQLFCILSSPS